MKKETHGNQGDTKDKKAEETRKKIRVSESARSQSAVTSTARYPPPRVHNNYNMLLYMHMLYM